MIYLELIYIHDVRYKCNLFARGCPLFPASFVEKTILSPLSCLGSFVGKSNDHTYFLDSQFYFVDYFIYLHLYFYASTTLSWLQQ